jgi:hypothetical protein
MLNQKMKHNRRILLVAALAAALAYHLFAGQVNKGVLLEREKAFVTSARDAFLASAAVTSIRKTFNRIEALVTGPTAAARATADADAKGAPPR